MTRIGRNSLRDVSNLTNSNNISPDLGNVRQFGNGPTMQKAVVVDVIMDPNMLTDDRMDAIRRTVNNPDFVDIMPVNSILARLVSETQGQMARANTILFPFFSSHFLLPVQPGEVVQVVYDDYMGRGNAIGYWLTRTSAERTVEDVNYTHLDRRFDASLNPANYTTGDRGDRSSDQPAIGFPNGNDTTSGATLAVINNNDRPYERLIENATTYLNNNQGLIDFESDGETTLTTPEPVPRWRKRPQEFVLQGANNTLICLGEDRKGGPLGALVDEAPDAKVQAGTIDIVTGRGRYLPPDPSQDPQQQSDDTNRAPTAPIITTNSRGNNETDKAPYRRLPGENRLKDNPQEGDPDFTLDAARLYVSMQTEADVNFGLTEIEYTEDTTPIVQPNEGETGTINKSYVVGKADHIRLIARSDLSADNSRGIDGTIAIIREGTSEDDEDGLGLIYIDKVGIQIEAPRINLGRGLANLASAGGDPTPGGEPYIRWSKFRDTIDSLHAEMDIMRTEYSTTFDNLKSTIGNILTLLQSAAAASVCIPTMPDPGFTAIASGLTAIVTPLNTADVTVPRSQADGELPNQVQTTDDAVTASQSEKIFGE